MRIAKSLRASAVVASLALALTACGGGDADVETDAGTGTGTATDGGTATATETTTETATETATDGAAAGDFNLIEEGTLTVCSDVPYAPFEMEADNELGYTGFDIELMQQIADQLGLEVQVRDLSFDAIQSGAALAANQCDVAASAMTITEEREQNVDFTEPYFDADQSLLVKQDSGVTSLADLEGETLGVQADTTGQAYAQENAPEGVEIREYPDAAALFAALEAGQISGILQDLPVNAERAQQDETLEIVEQYATGEQYGFAVAEEGHDQLLQAINDALLELRESGTYDQIYNQYFGTE